jgi:isopenicillin-N N-acyltransferase-like protein
MPHFPFFEIAGTAREVGRGHGECMREGIHQQLDECLAAASRTGGLSREQALNWAMEQLSKIVALGGPAWAEELHGLAEGAGISLAGAVALQVRPGNGSMPEACTSLAVSGDASASGRPLGAQNRDLVPAYRDRMSVLLLRPSGRPAVLMHSVPGEIGGVGINEHGLALFANSLWFCGCRNWQAAPVTRRALLECSSAPEAAEHAQKMDGPTLGSLLLIDPAGRIRNLESGPIGVAILAHDHGVFVHTNHCLDPTLHPHEVSPSPSPGSVGRYDRTQALLNGAAGWITAEEIFGILADHAGRPEPICRHAGSRTEWETTSGLVAEPTSRTLYLSYGPPCERAFATYRIALTR